MNEREVKRQRVVKKEKLEGDYKGSNLIGYRVPGGFWVNFFSQKAAYTTIMYMRKNKHSLKNTKTRVYNYIV